MRRAAPLVAVLAASLGLGAWHLDYGLPNIYSWAQDEIIPAEVLEGAAQRFSNGWSSRYPPLHYGLLAAAYAPVRWVSAPPSVSSQSKTYQRLFLTGRLLTLAMGLATLALVALCGGELGSSAAGVFAALVLALSPTLVYYSKFANLDVPCLCWFAGALLFLLRFLRTSAASDAVLLSLFAALSVGTKDQAYGLFVLVAPLVAWRLKQARVGLLWPALAFGVTLGAAHNLLFDWSGFWAHLTLISGDASRDYRMFEKSLAGQWAMLKLMERLTVFVLGAPAMVLALAGIAIAVQRRESRLLAALLPIASSQLFFSAVVLYGYDRFALPHALVLALFAGRTLAACPPRPRIALIAALLVFGLPRALAVDLMLSRDARYQAERWLKANAPPPARVAVLGPLEYLPRFDGLDWKQRTELVRSIEGMRPDFVVVNADFAARADDPRARELYAALDAGVLGYHRALTMRTHFDWPFTLDAEVRRDPTSLPTNLDKINPEIRVYARRK